MLFPQLFVWRHSSPSSCRCFKYRSSYRDYCRSWKFPYFCRDISPLYQRRKSWVGIGVLATASAVAGNILLVSSQRDMSMNIAGIIYALIAGLSYAMYSLTSKKLLENYSPEEVMSSVGIIAGILLLPLLLINNISWVTEPRGMLIALHLGFSP